MLYQEARPCGSLAVAAEGSVYNRLPAIEIPEFFLNPVKRWPSGSPKSEGRFFFFP